ncbi:MAG: hypothetical protein ABFS14_05335 [Gemmatimonadota bacterium]
MSIYGRLWAIGLVSLAGVSCSGLGAEEENFAEVPSGTGLEVSLDGGVNTRTTQAGEAVSASVKAPVQIGADIVIPAGSVLRGSISAISEQPPSMTVVFSSLNIGSDRFVLDAQPTTVRLVEHSEMTNEGTKIGGGAAAGAVLGGVIGGNVKGAAIGAAAGAAAGTGVALATKDHWASLPSGSTLHVQLAAPIHVPVPEGESTEAATS